MLFQKLFLFIGVAIIPTIHQNIFAQSTNAKFRLLPESNFQVAGSTNVVDFFCVSEQSFSDLYIPLNQTENQFLFGYNNLKAHTKSLNCGGSGINKDMHKCLKANDFPYIGIELQKIVLSKALIQSSWINGTVILNLTIAGKKRTESFAIQIMKLPDNNYKIKGSHTIYLTNYNIEPPKAMLGLITVNNEIELIFDLTVLMVTG